MVYCGKPSRGCGLCRSRRIKCDQLQPGCTQCTRVGSSCPGYRNETDLVFRDLSENVKMKCMRAKPKKECTSRASLQVPESEPVTIVDQRLIKEPHAFSNDSAALFFFHDYVLLESQQPSNLFDTLPAIYQTSSPGSPLADIITALGLVCLSNTKGSPEALIPARARYIAALHSINASIRDPEAASADETLMAVLLLGLYEDNTATPGSLEQWSKHVKGALTLLDVRGAKQLETRVGRQLITNLRTSVFANCLLKHTRVPACILWWSTLLKQYESPEEVSATVLADIVAPFCELQELIQTGIASEVIIPIALQIDESLEKWAAIERHDRNLTSNSNSNEAPSLSALSFQGSYTTYHSLSAATRWNHYRSIRIMLHSIILAQLEPAVPSNISSYFDFDATTLHSTQITQSKILIITLSQDICASVRYCLNLDLDLDLTTSDSSIPQPSKAAYAKLLLWPLYTAGAPACVQDTTVGWIAEMFEFITRVTGVRRGASLAKALRAWPCGGGGGGTKTSIKSKARFREAVMKDDDGLGSICR